MSIRWKWIPQNRILWQTDDFGGKIQKSALQLIPTYKWWQSLECPLQNYHCMKATQSQNVVTWKLLHNKKSIERMKKKLPKFKYYRYLHFTQNQIFFINQILLPTTLPPLNNTTSPKIVISKINPWKMEKYCEKIRSI